MLKTIIERRTWISDKLIHYVDILFAVVVGQSIIRNIDLLRNPTSYLFAFAALIVVMITISLSWIGYHKSMYKYPYTAEILSLRRAIRPFSDFIIVVIYALFLFTVDDFKTTPTNINIQGFILFFAGIFFLYIFDGIIRILEYKDHSASKLGLSIKYFIIFIVLSLIHAGIIWYYQFHIECFRSQIEIINWILLLICLVTYVIYRIQREPHYPEPKSPPLIVVDIDGVLADQVTPILESLNDQFGSHYVKSEIRRWDQPLPLAKTDIKIAIESAHADPLYVKSMPLIQDAQKIMSELSKYCEITIATNRISTSDKPSKKWLRKNNIPFDHYKNTSIKGKGEVVGKILIDDYPKNILTFISAKEGRIGLLFSQPWNEDDQLLSGKDNVHRVHSWNEVLEKIKLLL